MAHCCVHARRLRFPRSDRTDASPDVGSTVAEPSWVTWTSPRAGSLPTILASPVVPTMLSMRRRPATGGPRARARRIRRRERPSGTIRASPAALHGTAAECRDGRALVIGPASQSPLAQRLSGERPQRSAVFAGGSRRLAAQPVAGPPQRIVRPGRRRERDRSGGRAQPDAEMVRRRHAGALPEGAGGIAGVGESQPLGDLAHPAPSRRHQRGPRACPVDGFPWPYAMDGRMGPTPLDNLSCTIRCKLPQLSFARLRCQLGRYGVT